MGGGERGPSAKRRAAYFALIRSIPPGRVATYGQIAALAGHPRHAREVGRALAELAPGSDVPWQRVVNASGRPSPRGLLGDELHQRRLLESEGVRFGRGDRIDLHRFGWDPDDSAMPRARARASV
jgi:methylated-DNA-protein-cysteine methyltransferase-like protein